jgi:uncharacterized protein (TIGR02118 family)
MIKLVVAYEHPVDPGAFDAHYASTHAPLARKIPELKRFEAGKILGTPDGSPAPYYFIAELLFEDGDTLRRAMTSPEGQAATNDLMNFATGGAELWFVEVSG